MRVLNQISSRCARRHFQKSQNSQEARYVNDVHLPRFDLPMLPPRAAAVRSGPYTEQPPASKVPYGDSKDFSPSNAWNDSKTAVLRQLPRPPKLALGVGHSALKRKFRAVFAQCGISDESSTRRQIYFHASGRRMTLPCVPMGISSGSWHSDGRSRGMFL